MVTTNNKKMLPYFVTNLAFIYWIYSCNCKCRCCSICSQLSQMCNLHT